VKRGNEKSRIGAVPEGHHSFHRSDYQGRRSRAARIVAPLNLAPITVETPRAATIRLEWKPVKDAVSYTCESAHRMFTKMVKQVKVSSTSLRSPPRRRRLFWNVFATDANKQNSEVSETFKLQSSLRAVPRK